MPPASAPPPEPSRDAAPAADPGPVTAEPPRRFAFLATWRDLIATFWPWVLLVLAGFAIAFQYVKPAPPRHVVFAAGAESGAYYGFAKRYAAILARNGISVEVQTSNGSADNLARLLNPDDPAKIAFVQGGIQPAPGNVTAEEPLPLHSLGAMYYEPLWVFYRPAAFPAGPVARLTQLAGKRLAIGGEGSGVRLLATQLLDANRVEARLSDLTGLKAAEALTQGRIDAAFLIAGPEAPAVQALLHSPGVALMSFAQADAYTRRFPFLSRIVLPRGAVDLVRDYPADDVVLLAPTANLVIHEDLHPALAGLFLEAASEVHREAGFFQRRGDFPAVKEQTFPLAPQAERYYKSGPPLLQRYLPFWAAVLADRLLVLLIPLLALLLPVFRLAPALYTWRVRSRVFRLYGELKFLESDIRNRFDPAQLASYRERLARIEEQAFRRRLPLAFLDLQYTLRTHIALVRADLDARGREAAP
ncbi:hypothetical protein OTERR_26610 [Oryzomicrobium terrae]|uniref:TRAP transporter solute receptor, TAXI family n=1 Tax=Oryzomicrobium terrae TaxID=1735038 RepID=A0A5C1ED87_9RHOO|nr:TAXI family TRAP transporter solute-binding subunit [Oryzomicrobium terrae]QEL66137.1 hypothetical protein OTERR_26610 [Oryzomicrobium terrae]